MHFKKMFFGISKSLGESKHDYSTDPIWPLVSMSQRQYQEIYLKSILNSGIDFYEQPIQQIAVSALKIRKGFIIPTGAHPEDVVKTSEQWTYVIFLIVLADQLNYFDSRNEAIIWIKSVIPMEIYDWLDSDVAESLISCCCNKISKIRHPIVSIIQSAKADVANRNCLRDHNHFLDWIATHLSEKSDASMGLNSSAMMMHKVPQGLLLRESVIRKYIKENDCKYSPSSFILSLRRAEYFVADMEFLIASSGRKAAVSGTVINNERIPLNLYDLNIDLVPKY